MQRNSATVRVPGTTANIGPGYDCLGIALGLFNEVTLQRLSAHAHPPAHAMADQTAFEFFSTARVVPFPFSWQIRGDVPQSRGLGSSVTVRLGILLALNVMCGEPLSAKAIFRICSDLEGHPDNAAPAQFGGFTVARPSGEFLRFNVDSALRFVLLIPEFEVLTREARKVLPLAVNHRDAVEAATNACTITAAFASQSYSHLRGAFTDAFHQPFRTPLIPFLPTVIEAGTEAGAYGGFLSGSGSTIACLTQDNPEGVARAMLAAAGVSARTCIVSADNQGATIHSVH